MTCLSLVSGEAMSNSSAAQEPSMEEILASIRRIISDEEAAIGDDSSSKTEPEADPNEAMSQEALDALFDEPTPEPEPEPEEEELDMAAAMAEMDEAEEPEEEDVLELSSEWQESELVEPQDDDVMFANIEQAKEEAEPAPLEEIVSKKLEEAVPAALESAFAAAPMPEGPLPNVERGAPLVSDDTSKKVTSAFGDLTHTILNNNSRTIENVVEDMLRPMLKAWLDQNLPVMVERLVRAEIERVSRGEQHYR